MNRIRTRGDYVTPPPPPVRVKSGAAIFGTPNRQPPPGNAIYERIPEM